MEKHPTRSPYNPMFFAKDWQTNGLTPTKIILYPRSKVAHTLDRASATIRPRLHYRVYMIAEQLLL